MEPGTNREIIGHLPVWRQKLFEIWEKVEMEKKSEAEKNTDRWKHKDPATKIKSLFI
jgi:hypothetical protein